MGQYRTADEPGGQGDRALQGDSRKKNPLHTMWSDPQRAWRARDDDRSTTLTFRLIARCGIDFHVLSALWMMKVGEKLEKELPDAARGNRLRRTRDGDFNKFASGSFGRYLPHYQKWLRDGMEAAQQALDSGQDIVIISSDITSFYHQLDPKFLTNDTFLGLFNAELDERQKRLHDLFAAAA